MVEWNSENSKLGWASLLEMAGFRQKTAVLFSSFGEKSGSGVVRGRKLLNFHKLRQRSGGNLSTSIGRNQTFQFFSLSTITHQPRVLRSWHSEGGSTPLSTSFG